MTSRSRVWMGHAAAWLFFGVVYFLGVVPFQSDAVPALAIFKLVWASIGFALTSAIGALFAAVRVARKPLSVAAPMAVAVSVAAAAAWISSLGGLIYWTRGSTDLFFTTTSLPFVAMNHVFILLAWSGGYLAFQYWQQSQVEQTKTVAALALAREAQLEMLRYQLNPHFLFNALASLRALIAEDGVRAQATVTRLSAFLRYTLGSAERTRATVAEEVAIVRDYLEIERVRFEDRLIVEYDVDPAADRLVVPSFLLHALVENAVKHGGEQGRPLTVVVATRATDDTLELSVENSGSLADGSSREPGLGLRNLVARLEGAFPGKHRFQLRPSGRGVRASVSIDRAALNGA